MRFIAGLAVASLSGLAAGATQQPADVYIFAANSQSSAKAPQLPKEVARHILLHRAAGDAYGNGFGDIPESIDRETALSSVALYGRRTPALFSQSEGFDASQLVVILEGVSEANVKPLKDALVQSKHKPAFAISDPPSSAANGQLLADFRAAGVFNPLSCDLASAVNPFDTSCWAGSSSVLMLDVQKTPELTSVLASNMKRLEKFVANGELEVTLVLLPESSRSSKLGSWNPVSSRSEIRRRDMKEAVITDADTEGVSSNVKSSVSNTPFHVVDAAKAKSLPVCFASFNSCVTRSGNCSGHGDCISRGKDCFVCKCKPTVLLTGDEPGAIGRKTVQWGGNVCQKEDISVQFWLLTGFTVAIVGIVAFAIGLLFSVGEEPLPGVIAAGVSRPK